LGQPKATRSATFPGPRSQGAGGRARTGKDTGPGLRGSASWVQTVVRRVRLTLLMNLMGPLRAWASASGSALRIGGPPCGGRRCSPGGAPAGGLSVALGETGVFSTDRNSHESPCRANQDPSPLYSLITRPFQARCLSSSKHARHSQGICCNCGSLVCSQVPAGPPTRCMFEPPLQADLTIAADARPEREIPRGQPLHQGVPAWRSWPPRQLLRCPRRSHSPTRVPRRRLRLCAPPRRGQLPPRRCADSAGRRGRDVRSATRGSRRGAWASPCGGRPGRAAPGFESESEEMSARPDASPQPCPGAPQPRPWDDPEGPAFQSGFFRPVAFAGDSWC